MVACIRHNISENWRMSVAWEALIGKNITLKIRTPLPISKGVSGFFEGISVDSFQLWKSVSIINMSVSSVIPIAGDINSIRENYDTSNPMIAEILKKKEERLKILQELNKQHQEEFDSSDLFLKTDFKKDKKSTAPKRSRKSEPNISLVSVRRSTRLLNSPNVSFRETEMCKSAPAKSNFIRPPNDYGAVRGIEVGTHWETRMECSYYGVHRPTVAGIHGGPDGAYSIALSGGYPEDVDEGHTFIYTGAGGRDLKGTVTKPKNLRTAPQTKDQRLEGTNLSLVKSIESKLPVRVIRGYKSPSVFAPETGYRYDGLYQVVEYWEDVGKTGHKIYRFRMERMKDQAPPPWETNTVLSPPGKKPIKEEDENLETEFPLDDYKENIAPGDYQPLSRNVNSADVKNVDNEIQMCIDFFCKAAVIKCGEDLGEDCNEEEFYGWD